MAIYPQLRPNGIAAPGGYWFKYPGSNYIGGGDWAYLQDYDDGSYFYGIMTNVDEFILDFETYALTANVRCAGARLVSRIGGTSDSFPMSLDTWLRPQVMGDGGFAGYYGVFGRFTSVSNPWYVAEFNQAALDALRACYRKLDNTTTPAISESYIQLDVRVRPTVTITSPATDQRVFPLRPTVNWNYDARGDAVAGHRVKVFTNAVVTGGGFNADSSAAVWDSGDVGGAASSKQCGTDLTPGQTYWFYVQIATDFLGGWYRSTWVGVRFIINTPPTISALGTTPATPITTTNQPAITGTYNDADGNPAYRFQVKIFTEAVYSAAGFNADTSPAVWDSGEYNAGTIASGGGFNIVVGVGLSPNVSFKAAVRAYEDPSAGRWGAWTLQATPFLIQTAPGLSYDPPAAPAINSVTTDQSAQRVVITLQGSGNLLTRNQASIDTGLLGWTSVGISTIFQRNTAAGTFLQGGGSLGMIPQVTGGNALGSTPPGIAGFPVVPGRTYTALASFKADASATPKQGYVGMQWYDAAGEFISLSQGATLSDTTTGWTQLTVTDVAPANAAYAAQTLALLSVTSGKVHYWDNLSFAPGISTQWTRGGLVHEMGNLADSFTRANNASSLGNADIGGAWSALSSIWGINNNRAYLASGINGTHYYAVLASNSLADGYVQADITLSTVRAAAGLIFRAFDLNNLLQVRLLKNASTDAIDFYKRDGGTWTLLGSVAAVGLVLGTTYKLRIEFYGGQIYIYLDGQLRLSYLMLSGDLDLFGSNGKHGMLIYPDASPIGDDLGSRIDNFAAGLLPTQRITLERSLDGEATWEHVRTAVDMNLGASQQGIVYDYEVPAGKLARYRAITEASEAGNTLVSPYSTVVAQATALTIDKWWLKDAVDPSLNMTVRVAPDYQYRKKEPLGIYQPMGRAEAVYVTDGPKGYEGQMSIWALDETTFERLEAILGTGRAVLLENPLGQSWWVKFADVDYQLLRAQPELGDTAPIRHAHLLTLPFTQVAAPAVI